MPKKTASRRTAIVPRVVFSVAVSAAVIPSLVGCGSERRPPPPTTTAPAPPPSTLMAVAITPPSVVEPSVEEIDAAAPVAVEPPPPTKRARTRRSPPPLGTTVPSVTAVPIDDHRWELLGVAARPDYRYGVAVE